MSQKKFQFSLGVLLRVQNLKEKHALGKLAESLRGYNIHQSKVNHYIQEIKSQTFSHEKLNKEKKYKFTLEQEVMWDNYFKRIQKQIKMEESTMEKLLPELKNKQDEVQKATQERKVLELLKEEEKRNHKNKIQKKERKEIDAINQKASLKKDLYRKFSYSKGN